MFRTGTSRCRSERDSDLGRDRVRVDVVRVPVVAHPDRRDHRYVAAPEESCDRLLVDLGHAPDVAHRLVERLGDDRRPVFAAHPDRLSAQPVDGRHQVGYRMAGGRR